ncbi:MAG TPA: glycosyltransferase [Stellaceae bacterium]|nr:glycosyltransferase [Stellaceae bacterium]
MDAVVEAEAPAAPTPARPKLLPVTVEGKFLFAGNEKLFLKGVTYGPFAPGGDLAQFPAPSRVAQDFALMAESGVNTVRVFTVPPGWLLDLAGERGLRVLAGIPWAQHITFLADRKTARGIRDSVLEGVRGLERHPALLAYLIGNEIPPDMIRWHGVDRVRDFLKDLAGAVHEWHPEGLISYANFPSTEYLTVDFTDFVCFNVYLHDQGAFRRYVARLHNLAIDRPLVLTEFGMDTMRQGEAHQAETLEWQVRTAFELGCAGTCVFAWTDEWFTGGHLIEDWAFGLVDRDRVAKPSLARVAAQYRGPLPPPIEAPPRVSVVVCAYNSERTLEPCLASLQHLDYPDYEVILVNDGSTDGTRAIADQFPFCRVINQENQGLSVARNVGAAAASGSVIAYTDSDCVADRDWLTYLVAKLQHGGLAAVGGPNFPPPENALVPAAVAVSPGGPTHVLISDEVAEHIAGCNMAFRRDVLMELGGFDPLFRAAGDDVDICWRFQNAGYTIGFAPAAVVWHFRRNTVEAYLQQQRGYGKAEALVYGKHPLRFNLFGQAKWLGRIYGDLSASLLLSRRPLIYSGTFGRGLFQTMYEPPSSLAAYLPLSFEWNVAAIALAVAGIAAGGWWSLLLVPILTSWAVCISGAMKAPIDPRFRGLKARALIALLIYLGPLVRGWTRLKWRLKETRAEAPQPRFRPAQRARVDWRDRALLLSYWGEHGEEKEVLVGGVMAFLVPRKYFVQIDEGWNDWDLKISRGLWSRALFLVCGENHGGGKRVLRVRCTLRLSRLGTMILRGWALATAAALIAGLSGPAVILAAAGLLHFAYMAGETARFGRIMHRVTEEVALDAGLTPMADRSGP